MPYKLFRLSLAAGVVLSFSPVAFSQPVFGPPQNLGSRINSQYYESDPFWDGPRKRLYFVKAGPMTSNGSEDIWYADWTGTGWTVPKSVGTQINTEEIEHSPSVSPDGKKLYFIRYPWDVLVSTWDSALADWGPPVDLGCPISTPVIEFSAKIAPDGKTLYYQSDVGGCNPIGGLIGLYSSTWDSSTGWSTPQYLGSNISDGNDPQYPSITADHKWLYFHKFVSDGISIFVSPWTGSGWGPVIDMRPQIGERAGTPSITPSGDSLFFTTPLLNSLGSDDIFMIQRLSLGVGDEQNANLPRSIELYQNYPNPFNAGTQISFFVAASTYGPVELEIYNILGKAVRSLFRAERFAGKKEIFWDSRDNCGKEVSSGIYFYVLQIGSQRFIKKAVLIR